MNPDTNDLMRRNRSNMKQQAAAFALNAICPYYTMYPLRFPLGFLARHGSPGQWVLDPFCGRGTTNFAARLCEMHSHGADSSSVAVAIASAKLADTSSKAVIDLATRILNEGKDVNDLPEGEFWTLAYDHTVLRQICRLREALLKKCDTDSRLVLRAILLGALHGPVNKETRTYLSNQCPRTFAPKPAYAMQFWRREGLLPPNVNVLDVIRRRANHYLRHQLPRVKGQISEQDSRLQPFRSKQFSWVITSPPYYGMRTYVPDQWLRNWFVGGEAKVTYRQRGVDMEHTKPDSFANQLRQVWCSAHKAASGSATLLCRFGGIRDRNAEPLEIIKESLKGSGWSIRTIRAAGDANTGKRQASQFGSRVVGLPRREYDIYAGRV
jgi:hypothetical protein